NQWLPLLGQAVADGDQHVAARGEIGSPDREGVARARLPAAAVHGDERGKWPVASRQVKIAEQRYAVMAGVGDPAAGLDRLRCRHSLSPQPPAITGPITAPRATLAPRSGERGAHGHKRAST